MYKEQTLEAFIQEVNSNKPAPGGGSVSALSISLGIALIRMYQHLSIGKKKYQQLSDETRLLFDDVFSRLEETLTEMLVLIDRDTEAFNDLMMCFKMPKATTGEQQLRKERIQEETVHVIDIPLKVSRLGLDVLRDVTQIASFGNHNAITDLGCGALLIHAGIEGALLNVKVKLASLSDLNLKASFET